LRDLAPLRLAGLPEEPERTLLAPDRRRTEAAVAEAVVVVRVRVDHDPDGQRRERADVGQDLVALRVGDPRVDDQGLVPPEHEADLLVVEAIAADQDAVGDLRPRVAHGTRW